jgi:DNA-binding beta-propeller fold protein YncE
MPGYLMIADRDNNRVIVVSPARQIVWRFPPTGSSVASFSQPDDAFVSADGSDISTNQEFAETITVITLTRQPRIVWQYGHYDVQGSAASVPGPPRRRLSPR